MINRVAERIRVGLEDAEMLANIDQAQLDTMAQAIMDARRVYIAGWGRAGNCIKILAMDCSPVSYTHLDVYKRQSRDWLPGMVRQRLPERTF